MTVHWINKQPDTFLSNWIKSTNLRPKIAISAIKIELVASKTNKIGEQELWEGYGLKDETRSPQVVRTSWLFGLLYRELAIKFKSHVIVEFGAAFGVSGMYWLSAIAYNEMGHLYSFEPNRIWYPYANYNMASIDSRYTLVEGTFEENIEDCLKGESTIDIALIDAIHKPEFVQKQLGIILDYSSDHLIVIIDDIYFSNEMYEFWKEIANDSKYAGSVEIGERIGILEFNS